MNTRIDAALILWNTDVIQLVSMALKDRKLNSNGIEPCCDNATIEEFIVSCNPSVVLFDLRPPYKASTTIARALLNRFADRAFVFTCADPVLAIRAAEWLSCYHLLQKPYSPDEIAGIVHSLVSRVTRWVFEVEEILDSESELPARSETVIVS